MGLILLPLLKVLAWFLGLQPRAFFAAEAQLLGLVLKKLKIRSQVVLQNLEIAYPGEKFKEERARLFSESYRSLAQLGLEILLLLGPMKRFVLARGELRGLAHWQQAKAQGKGVLFLASHVGNWEIMAATGALHGEMDLMIVTKHLKPEWLHQAIEKGRSACGVLATYEPRTLKDVLAHLKRNGTVGFVLDQYAGPPVGVRVPFFGVAVGTMTALAMLARRTGAQVLPVVNYRQPDGKVITEIRPALKWLEGETELAIAQNTARYAEAVERDIRAHPEQWLWIHRRFKGDLGPVNPEEWQAGRARQ